MKVLAIVKYVFTLLGIGILLGAFALYSSTTSFLGKASRVEGTVVDLVQSRSNMSSSSSTTESVTYRPVVHFVDLNGNTIEFTSSTGSNPPSYSRGEQVEVLYLPDEPEKAKINGFFSLWGGPVILGILGGLFFLIGGGILLVTTLKGRRDEYLKKHGKPIETVFQGVELNESVSVNGRNPFRILTQWQNPTTQEVHVFHSNNLWFNPSDYINRDKITVFIDPKNPKKYFVDISFLPKAA